MEDNLKRLGENNIKGLVLDLRENPGGLLNEGVAVADHFLAEGADHRFPPRPHFSRKSRTSHATATAGGTIRLWCW